MVLGLRVKSLLPDPMAVLLTVAQNRFLLNSGGTLIHTLLVSDQWDSGSVGGEEVDIDLLLPGLSSMEPAQ